MKKILLVALLVAAACNKKSAEPDCEGAMAKAIENFAQNVKEHAPNPEIASRMTGMFDKLKVTLTTRCKEDKWPAEVVTCYTTVHDRKDMQGCQTKLTAEQRTKLTTEITQVMMGGTAGMPRMPPGMAGHPETLAGSSAPPAAGAPAAPSEPAAGGAAAPAPAAAAGSGSSAAGGW